MFHSATILVTLMVRQHGVAAQCCQIRPDQTNITSSYIVL
jgi:hypothetical protein